MQISDFSYTFQIGERLKFEISNLKMPTNVIMPSLGFDMTQGKLARWLKNEGEPVNRGEAIAEVETEKATVEIEAFANGVLQKILVQAGETVPVNTTIGVIAEPGETVPLPAAVPPKSVKEREETGAPVAPPVSAVSTAASAAAPENGRLKVSPIARRMAEEAGIDLHMLRGSGPGGRIMEKDVKAAIAQKQAAPSPAPATVAKKAETPVMAPSAPPVPPSGPAQLAAIPANQVTLSRMRQAIAQRMAQSKSTVPHFYVTVEIEMSDAMKMREQLNNLASDTEKISVNDLIVAAVARTLTKFATFNASYQGDKLELHPNIHIGIAVAVEDGLLTPTLPDADKKSLKQIAVESKGIGERARANKLRPEDLTPSTFTVSNLGMFGVDEFAAIINPPQAAILAVGAVAKRAVVVGDELKIAPTMKVTLAVDHRVADGAQAGRFLQELKKLLENPVNLLLA